MKICRFDNDRDAAWCIPLVHNLVELLSILALAGAAFDRALYVIARHTLRARSLDRAAQTRIASRIASAPLCRDGDLL